MSQPVAVPSAVFRGLNVLLDSEVCSTTVTTYVSCAAERGYPAAAGWIATHPANFAVGLLYGFTPAPSAEGAQEGN